MIRANLTCAVVLWFVSCHGSWAQQNSQGVPKEAPARKGQAAKNPGRQQYPTESAPFPVRVIESPSDAADRQSREAKADQHEAKDLEAQMRSADAAEKQVSIGVASAVLSFFGLLALIWTLRETRRAASAAIRAARAAEDAVKDNATFSRQELRAYLNVFEVDIEWSDDEALAQPRTYLRINIKNTGLTPARNVRAWMGYVSSAKQPERFGELEADSPAVSGPGQSFWMAAETTILGDDKVALWRRGQETLYVWGKVTYIDVFDQPRETSFRYSMPREGVGDNAGRFRPCSEGNTAT